MAVHAFLQRNAKSHQRGKESSHCLDDFPDAKWYQTTEEFMAEKEIELVVVATGHDSRADLAVDALNGGKHVVVEKCFTLSSAEADRCLAAQKKSGKVLTVFQNRRYESDFRTLSHIVNHPDKPLGQITECEIHYDVDSPAWAMGNKSTEHSPGGGMMFGIGCHTMDQALALFGRPAFVTGFYRALRGIKSKEDDTFTLILQYSGVQENLVVTVKTTVINKMPQPLKYFIRGYNGTYIKYGEDPQEGQTGKGMTPADPGYGVESTEIHGILTSNKQFHEDQMKVTGWAGDNEMYHGKFPSLKGSYLEYYEDVVNAIRGEAPVAIKPELSRDGLRIIELGRESAELGKTLPMD
ncbi:hypothetical protein JCM24511_06144 [Saitozyma sp. JCM 24511]|nr:hypothetical protein JCM24511_06144 [Saitozyma sp. JCM 24511]